jgi:hypothetical protein
VLRVRYPPTFAAERRYIVDVLLREFLGLECVHEPAPVEGFELSSPDGGPGRVVVADGLFRHDEGGRLTEAVLPKLPLTTWDVARTEVTAPLVTSRLPVLYGAGNGDSPLALGDGEVRLRLDVFGSAFFMLTRLEEAICDERDRHRRFAAAHSLAARAGFLDRPIVNEYLEILWWALKRLWPRLTRQERSFRLRPTHDVDFLSCSRVALSRLGRQAAVDLVRRRDPLLALHRARSYAASRLVGPHRDLCNTFDFIMRTSEDNGCSSAFYFMTGRTDARFDGDYALDDPAARRVLRAISGRGHEVGLHPSYGTYRNGGATRAEFESLLRVCEEERIRQHEWGGRQHFLRWENPTTWVNWAEAGLEYDSTLGFPDAAGFRSGVCFEYPAFDVRAREPLRLRERPLIVMDATLTDYEGLSLDAGADRALGLKRICRTFGGDFVLLWHNNRLVRRSERRAYRKILEA